jgi:hypothetical protein
VNRALNQGRIGPVLAAMLLAAAIVIPRALLVARAHSDTVDDEYHLTRGIRYWMGILPGTHLNDPPLGEALGALPLYLAGVRVDPSDGDPSALYGQPRSAEMLQLLLAGWKGLLFVPLAGVVFAWVRGIYGVRSGWLATGMLCLDPNFAAFIHVGSVDVLGVEGIVIGCFVAWRYFQRRTVWRAAGLGAAVAAALMLKHTAIILPGVIVVYGIAWWLRRRWRGVSSLFPVPGGEGGGEGLGARGGETRLSTQDHPKSALPDSTRPSPLSPALSPEYRGEGGESRGAAGLSTEGRGEGVWRCGAARVCLAVVVCLFSIWALSGFDYSHPAVARAVKSQRIWQHIPEFVPAGTYVGSLLNGMAHAERGHAAYLLGRRSKSGWWYYFAVVATYKVPLAVFALMVLSGASLRVLRPRFEEWGLLLPMLAWSILLMSGKVNIGFRHFLPAYAFMLMLASRCAAAPGRRWLMTWMLALAALAIDSGLQHPDYLSYMNFPRRQAYLAINDSNVDWGQSLKQIRAWLDAHPQRGPVYLRYFGKANSPNVRYFLDDRVRVLGADDPPPPHPSAGILIISPFWEAGVWDAQDRYAFVRGRKPIAVIGHAMRVYDLDGV